MAYIDDPDTQRANLTFIRASMKEPLLSREHEHDLVCRWRLDNDEAALHELIRSYTRLVIGTASKFRNYGLPMGDLVQEGNVGLMQAAARFDPEREVPGTSAKHWARPTLSARLQVMSSTVSARMACWRFSAQSITTPPTASATATVTGLNR